MSQGQETSQTQQQQQQQQQQREQGDPRLGIMLFSLVVEIGLAGVVFYFLSQWTFLGGIIVAIALFLISSFLVAFLWWAPNNICFTFMEEATSKAVLFAGKPVRMLIQWRGKTLDREGNVVEESQDIKEPWHPFGGFRFYGIYPFHDIHIHRQRWNDIRRSPERAGGRITEVYFHDEILDNVILREDVYWTRAVRAETKPPERIPVNVDFAVTMRVINPYKVLFVAPINWVENLMDRLDALLRGFVADNTIDELLVISGIEGAQVWDQLQDKPQDGPLIQQTFKKEWGIEIVKGGIQIIDIEIQPPYAEAAAAERTEQMKAEGQKKRIETEWGAIQEFENLGRLIRTLEAVEKSPLAASLTVQAVPGLQEVLRGVFEQRSEQGGRGRRRR